MLLKDDCYCCCWCCSCCTKTRSHNPAGQGNTMALKDELVRKSPPKNVQHCFWNPRNRTENLCKKLAAAAVPPAAPAKHHATEGQELRLLLLVLPMLLKDWRTTAAAAAERHGHTTLPDGETPWPWRTNESENPTKKVSNVASETLEKEEKIFAKNWLQLLLLLLRLFLLQLLLLQLLFLLLLLRNTMLLKDGYYCGSCCCCYCCCCAKTRPHNPAGPGNTMALKDERVRESHQKSL